jgi:hypothetical protein
VKRTLIVIIALIASLAAARAWAHHSFAATYIEAQKVTVEGDLVQFQWRNPHSFVQIVAKNPKGGAPQRWSAEWGSGGQLGQQGVAKDTLKVGDHIIITGDPSRTAGDLRLRVRTIYRPADGWRWGGEFD